MRAIWLQKNRVVAIFLLIVVLLCLTTTGMTAESKPAKKRGWIGVSVQELTPSLRDAMKLGNRSGLLINDVVAGSPAENAGLQEEDVLLEFNGEKVERTKHLSALVRETEPRTEVKVKIFRDGKEQTVSLTVGRLKPQGVGAYSFGSGDNIFVPIHRAKLGVHVTELNDDLAPYFKVGTSNGVLVLRVEKDSPAEKAGLKAGDIILKIDDDKVRDYQALMEVLGYYDEGDEVNVEYVRQGKNSQVAITLIAQGDSSWGFKTPDGKTFDWNFFEKDGNRIRISPPGSHERLLELRDNMMMLRDMEKGDNVRIRVRSKHVGDSI